MKEMKLNPRHIHYMSVSDSVDLVLVADDMVKRLCDVGDVLLAHCRQCQLEFKIVPGGTLTAADGCSTGLEQVDVVLVLQGVHLLRGQTGVGEHAVLMTRLVCYHGYMLCRRLTYLVDDVLPGTGGLQTNKLVVESLAHALDARAHFLQILVPLRCELVVGQDLLDDAAAGS